MIRFTVFCLSLTHRLLLFLTLIGITTFAVLLGTVNMARADTIDFTEAMENFDLSVADIITCVPVLVEKPCSVQVVIVNNGNEPITSTTDTPVQVNLFSPEGGFDKLLQLPQDTVLSGNGGIAMKNFEWVPEFRQTSLTAIVDPENIFMESNEANNEATISVSVSIERNIPTLSQWGLIAMAGVIGLAGFIAIRKKYAIS